MTSAGPRTHKAAWIIATIIMWIPMGLVLHFLLGSLVAVPGKKYSGPLTIAGIEIDWIVLAVLLPLSTLMILAAVKGRLPGTRRVDPSACHACGYDLNGIDGACPECGGEQA